MEFPKALSDPSNNPNLLPWSGSVSLVRTWNSSKPLAPDVPDLHGSVISHQAIYRINILEENVSKNIKVLRSPILDSAVHPSARQTLLQVGRYPGEASENAKSPG